jgi:uncharacterized protein
MVRLIEMHSAAYFVLALAIALLLFAHPSRIRAQLHLCAGVLLTVACAIAISSPDIGLNPSRLGVCLLIGGLVILFMIGLHLPRGAFNNQVVVSQLRITPDAIPFTQYLNFDKGIAGALLLLFVVRTGPSIRNLLTALKTAFLISAATLLIFIPLIVFSDHARYIPKWPEFASTFLFANFFFTVVAEECFFRGVLQEQFHRWMEKKGRSISWNYAGIVALSLPFAMMHITHSWIAFTLIVLASCAYGIVYFRTRSIEAAVFTHFAVNAVHFLFFTYPHVQS